MDSSNNKYIRTHNETNKYKKKSMYAENDNTAEMNNKPISQDSNADKSNKNDRDNYSVDRSYSSKNDSKENDRVSKQLETDLQKREKLSTNDIISRYLGKKVKQDVEDTQEASSKSVRSSSERKIVNDFPVISDYEEKKRLRQARMKQRKMLLAEDQEQKKDEDNSSPLAQKLKWFQKINNEDAKSSSTANNKTYSANIKSDQKNNKREPFITEKDNIPSFSEYFDNMDRVNHEVTEIPSSYNPSLGTPIHHQISEDDIIDDLPKKKKFSWAFWRKNNNN